MFRFSTKLHIWKNRVKKNKYSSIYIYVAISVNGKNEKGYFPLNLDWPHDLIDFENSILKPRSKNDADCNDYNMIIMSERAKFNEIAKVFRLTNRQFSLEALKRDIILLKW